MQCARPREVLVDDLWDDYALRLMQRDYFETPSQPSPNGAAERDPGLLSPKMAGVLIFFGFGAAVGIGIIGAGIYFLTEVLAG